MQFLLQKDKEKRLKFAPLQGQTAATILNRHPDIEASDQSVVLVQNYGTQNELLLQRSDAILNIFKEFGGVWRMLCWIRIIPRFIRDALYDWIARNRYKWFGKYSECRLPTPDLEKRFLS
ncbi:DUF393 domain-containing protein [candidate division KSB1 bacterium]|nr:DUF393 domain-containing protein [candidate division KSB1 bacterium]